MKFLFAALAAVLLAGCAAHVVSSSPRTVVIAGAWNRVAEAQTLADAECGKHKRFARLVSKPRVGENQHLFDCVE